MCGDNAVFPVRVFFGATPASSPAGCSRSRHIHLCRITSRRAVGVLLTSLPASAVASSLIGKLVSFGGSSLRRGPHSPPGLSFLCSTLGSTTPTPSDVAPVFKSLAPGPTITSPSLFLTKWRQSVVIVRRSCQKRNRPTLQLPLKGTFQKCYIPTLSRRWRHP